MPKANDTDIYKYDLSISLMDYLFGSDADNGKKNKSYRIKDIIQLINGVNGKNNLQYLYSDGNNPDLTYYNPGVFFTDTNEADPLAFTQLIVNKSSLQPIDLTSLFQRLGELEDVVIKLDNPSNPNNFFNFKVIAIEDHIEYFIFQVELFKDFYLGEFLNETIYSVYFDIKSATESDDSKLDKASYTGNATDIDNRILVLENLQDLNTNFTGQAFAVWTGVGYVYDVIYPDYYIQGVLYPGGTVQKTLDPSDAVHPRFDVFYVNALGAQIKTGIPAANPLMPTIDTETELFITSQLVAALSVVPEDSTLTQVYDENVEWAATSNNSSAINFNATAMPFKGTKHGDIGAFVLGQSAKFTNATVLSVLNYTTLKFAINLKGNFGKTRKMMVQFLNGSTIVSSAYYFGAGQNNFVHNIVNSYQLVVIDFSSFTFYETAFDSILIDFGSANSFGFRLDDIVLVKGSTVVSPSQKAITSIVTDSGIANATIKDDTFQFKGANGLVVSAVGKIITFTSNFTAALKSNYDAAYAWVLAHGNVDNTSDANKPVSIAQQAALDLKVDKVTGKGLSTEDYTTSEKNKLASIDATHYLAPLQTTVQLSALPQATVSDKARVYVEAELSDYFYDTTASSGEIAPDDQVGGVGFWRKVAVGGETAASIKTKYESNADTNAFTNALKAKLDSFTEIFTTALKTNYDSAQTWISTNGAAVLAHISSAHAPSNAQKNSDITKAEIEAKLTGEITTHTHPAVGGGGDMVLASSQTVSGLKTFLSGMFGLRNVANTFTSFFTNSNTAARTYTLKDRNGTLIDDTDYNTLNSAISGKMANPTGGVASYLPKFITATTIGVSRLWDTGTFFGIGTAFSPIKDISLGNQNNREIGVEDSNSITKGRDLTIGAGRAINFAITSQLQPLLSAVNQTTNMFIGNNNNIFVTAGSAILYKQTAGSGNFDIYATGLGNITGGCEAPNGDVYVCILNGDIKKQTGGTGSFVSMGQTSRGWFSMTALPNGEIYAAIGSNSSIGGTTGDIYKLISGTFAPMGFTARDYRITACPNGDLLACVNGGSVYRMISGSGVLTDLLVTNRAYQGISTDGTDIFICVFNGDVYKQTNNTGSFNAMGQITRGYMGLAYSSIKTLYTTGYPINDVYSVNLQSLGAADLDGGSLKHKAGTGKGSGKSRYEIYTGQKTTSGTDMQVETLREYIDENGYHIYISIPSYANDAAADADTNLPSGAAYKLTGNRTIFHKP